ncbi:hypothetical protein JOQ06_009901, partial [Pogonophryne albipinna]
MISASLRFDDRLTRPARYKKDKLTAFRNMWDNWTECLPLLFNPGEDICVDEQLVAFRGRCKFRQYIPSKPAKYGLKIWITADVATSYAWRCQELLKKKVALVGTIRANKPELPPKLKQTKQRAVLSSVFAFTTTTTAVSYIPRRGRHVLLLSSKHREPAVHQDDKKKPQVIIDYNRCKGGVDNLDK